MAKKGNVYQVSFKENIQEIELMDYMLDKAEIMGISTYIKMLIKSDMEKNRNIEKNL
ncbi:hypothetical protein [Metaclostridioides mangenotii]|uniref:Uncharacterized protein n=1 Tax=Metaclostridioides mangenotii TaxID=1540 RepID=A0ABS4E9P9_9FIRM|nr:hypothetical protein [Clostridioides mangenotii]MBP1854633.1 hypothetical protein [Clostridioides mangenotii]